MVLKKRQKKPTKKHQVTLKRRTCCLEKRIKTSNLTQWFLDHKWGKKLDKNEYRYLDAPKEHPEPGNAHKLPQNKKTYSTRLQSQYFPTNTATVNRKTITILPMYSCFKLLSFLKNKRILQ